MQKEFKNNIEMSSLLNNNDNSSTNNKTNNINLSNEAELFNSRSKNSSETILVEKDYKNVSSDPLAATSSLLINDSGDQAHPSNIDVKIIDPKKEKKKKKKQPVVNNDPVQNQVPIQSSQQLSEDDENIEEIEEEMVLKYGAAHVIKLFIPVTICLIFVIISLSLITSYQQSGGATLIYTPFNEDSQKSNSTKLWMSIANASIFICVVVVMTILLILLYKFRCYKLIHGWLAFSSLMLLFFFTYMFIGEVFKQFNIVTDMITVSFILWNFGILGMACIHWKGPLILQQAFLIFTCVQMALIFIKYLPEWTTWVLLAFISIWDLIAVLCPFGPLRYLVETARSRNDTLFPAMVYSSTIIYTIMANVDSNLSSTSNTNNNNNNSQEQTTRQTASNLNTQDSQDEDGGFRDDESKHLPSAKKITLITINSNKNNNNIESSEVIRKRHHGNQANNNESSTHVSHNPHAAATLEHIHSLEQQQEEEEENGVKLGLGDFIFYSILVGKASILGDWNTVIACFLAILIGLCFTLVLLAIYHKPLPALPISLLFGLIFYFSTNLLVRPFYDNLAYRQYFI